MKNWKSLGLIETFQYSHKGQFVRHRVTGEVMMLLDSGDGYGSGQRANVERFNYVTGTYEQIVVARKSLELVEESKEIKEL